MKKLAVFFMLLAFSIFLSGCREKTSHCPLDINEIDFTFGIDYDHPETYLIPGEQSDLSDENFELVRKSIDHLDDEFEEILRVCHWINRNFTFQDAGGSMAGVQDVNMHFVDRVFYGCHSLSLIISSVLRKYGFPTVMIETADIQWAYDEYDGMAGYMKGHVMTEVFVEGQWILLDNNCKYVKDYDYTNPYIQQIMPSQKGWFVLGKGFDTWDYSNRSEDFTRTEMKFFSDNVFCYEELFYTVVYNWDY
ncbi:MAG: hypothetical protein HOK84_13915 [Bacteroidetes bacterium]|nr:hypothetical protein [Bacteroidota bacterium]